MYLEEGSILKTKQKEKEKIGRQGSHMLVEREECCLEDHKQRNNLSLLPLSFLLAETDGLESDWIASGFLWDFCPLCVLSICTCTRSFILTHVRWRRPAISNVS